MSKRLSAEELRQIAVDAELPEIETDRYALICRLLDHADALETELTRLHSWDGLIELLNEHWPAEIFNGSSGDPGPTIVALIRVIDGLQQDNASQRAAVETADVLADAVAGARVENTNWSEFNVLLAAISVYRATRATITHGLARDDNE